MAFRGRPEEAAGKSHRQAAAGSASGPLGAGRVCTNFPTWKRLTACYRVRDFEFVTVSTNTPDEEASVMKMLEKQHASSRNLLFGSDGTHALQAAFNPKWTSVVPYTVLISRSGAMKDRATSIFWS
jgi:hypothetical protein